MQRFHRSKGFYDTDTYQVPGIVTHQHVTFTRLQNGSTQVVEHLTFEAPQDYIQTAVQGGLYAHSLVQTGLKHKIKAGQLTPIPFPRYLGDSCGDDAGEDDNR